MCLIDIDTQVRSFTVEIYAGSENPLKITRKYNAYLICDFNLMLYPFDSQHCDIHLKLHSGSKRYLRYSSTQSKVANLGTSLLVEYQVGFISIC